MHNMRISILILALTSFYFKAYSQEIKLEILGESNTFVVGENVDLKLTIKNSTGSIDKITLANNQVINLSNFSKKISFVTEKVGQQTIGPFTLTINKCDFTSNTVQINVSKKQSIKNSDSTIVIIAPSTVKTNQIFTLQVKSNFDITSISTSKDISNADDLLSMFATGKTFKLKTNQNFEQVSSSMSSNTKIERGVSISEYIYTFELKALKKGDHKILGNSFSIDLSEKLKTSLLISVK
tara:strand:+ start:43 stop:759 length:717 start_codon:yes stop_codon:yes gene_type:complete